jgi:hypothetical protein
LAKGKTWVRSMEQKQKPLLILKCESDFTILLILSILSKFLYIAFRGERSHIKFYTSRDKRRLGSGRRRESICA